MKDKYLKLLSGNILLTFVNLLRDMSIATVFGASIYTDQFFLAISIPVLVITIAGNACRNTFIPILIKVENRAEQIKIGSGLTYLIIKYVFYVAAIALSLSLLIYYFTLGQSDYNYINQFSAVFISILPMYLFAALIQMNQGTLQAVGQYFLPNLLRLGLPLGLILGAFIGVEYLGIYTLSFGGFIGALVCVAILLLLIKQAELTPSMKLRLSIVERHRIRTSIFSLILAYSITYVNPVIDQWMAGLAGDGSVSLLGYSSRIAIGIAGLTVGPIAPVVLSYYSNKLAQNKRVDIEYFYRNYFVIAPWIGCLLSLLMWLVSGIMVELLFSHGELTAGDANIIIDLIDIYACQFPLYITSVAAYTLISAIEKNNYFIRLGTAMFFTNIVGNYVFLNFFGLSGIAISTVVVYAFSLFMMNWFVMRQGYFRCSIKDGLLFALPILLLVLIASLFDLQALKISLHSSLHELMVSLGVFIIYSALAVRFILPATRRFLESK